MYADDTNLTVCGETDKEIEKNLNSELENVHKCLLVNKLTLNVKKTEYIYDYWILKITDECQIKIDIGGKDPW